MRIGEVIGKVTLSQWEPKLCGARFPVVRPNDPASLRAGQRGKGDVEVLYDQLGARLGDRVGFSEGREAAMPFHPTPVAVDAYLVCILDDVTLEK